MDWPTDAGATVGDLKTLGGEAYLEDIGDVSLVTNILSRVLSVHELGSLCHMLLLS